MLSKSPVGGQLLDGGEGLQQRANKCSSKGALPPSTYTRPRRHFKGTDAGDQTARARLSTAWVAPSLKPCAFAVVLRPFPRTHQTVKTCAIHSIVRQRMDKHVNENRSKICLQQSLTLEIFERLARYHIASGVLKLLLELGFKSLLILCYRDLLPYYK